jgi:penicillin amidase
MGLWLSGNWRHELERARLAATLRRSACPTSGHPTTSPGRRTRARARDRGRRPTAEGRPRPSAAGDAALAARDAGLPPRLSTAPPSRPAGSAPRAGALAAVDTGYLSRLLTALPRFPEPGTLPHSASNAWAVSGARSASGAPLLASDPHLGFDAPVLWYLARMDIAEGGRVLAGATSPGVPGIVIGRTRDLAWGFTTTHSDTQDVFVETPAGPDAYETPEGPRPFTAREETIAVRGADPVRVRLRETRHGPVISDLDPEGAAGGRVLAVSMANLAPNDTSAAGLLALNSARTVAEGPRRRRPHHQPAAEPDAGRPRGRHRHGADGRTPIRRAGDGSRPAPGADGSHDWTGWAPFDALPHAQDPPGGALANANNRVSPPGHPVFLGRDWFGDWRFRRVGEMLPPARATTPRASPPCSATPVSLPGARTWRRRPTRSCARRPAGGVAGAAYDLLMAWDGNIAADRPEPVWSSTPGCAPPAASRWRTGRRPTGRRRAGVPPPRPVARRRGAVPGAGATAPPRRPRACGTRWPRLQATEGPDPAAWRWGRVHVARFEHPICAARPS